MHRADSRGKSEAKRNALPVRLAMVHGVAEQFGGWFTLRSRLGEGTTAELWLPVAEGQAPAMAQGEEALRDVAMDQPSLTVLAVDDDELVLTNTVAMLEDLGHLGIAASSGRQALDILKQRGSVDLVITDYAMPGMTGLDLANAIKKQWPEMLVVIATGFAEMAGERWQLADACEAVHRDRASRRA